VPAKGSPFGEFAKEVAILVHYLISNLFLALNLTPVVGLLALLLHGRADPLIILSHRQFSLAQ
jgi:hypothetical protein